MSRRPSTLFRGSELPRLLFLVAIVLAGWPMIVLFARSNAEDKPPAAPPILASEITPVVPDDSVEFQALRDKVPIQIRESAAYAKLLQKARDTPPVELAKEARRDIFFTHLYEHPEKYRGVPVHLEGTVKKVLTYEVAPSMSPKGRLYEAWLFSDENRVLPYVIIFEDPPAGLTIGPELFLRVKVDGYFFKILGYHAGDKPRGAPMLVGRLTWLPVQAAAPSPMVELRNWSKKDGFVFLFVLLLGYIGLRAFFQIRKAIGSSRTTPTYRSPSEGVPPEDVHEWLQNLPDEEPEEEDAHR